MSSKSGHAPASSNDIVPKLITYRWGDCVELVLTSCPPRYGKIRSALRGSQSSRSARSSGVSTNPIPSTYAPTNDFPALARSGTGAARSGFARSRELSASTARPSSRKAPVARAGSPTATCATDTVTAASPGHGMLSRAS